MLRQLEIHAVHRPFLISGCLAIGALLTAAAAWVLAHEGHAALPSRGAALDPNHRERLLVQREAQAALGVETAVVEPRSVADKVVAPASVVARWDGLAYATAPLGGRILKLHVQPGQAVVAGQLVAEVQSLALQDLQRELLEAHNETRLAKANLADLKNALGAVSGQQLTEAEAREREARDAVDLARHKLLGLGLPADQLDQASIRPAWTLPIRSPLAGTVQRVHVQIGQVIDAAHHLIEIVDTRSVWIKIGVLEHDLARVDAGHAVAVRLNAYPGRAFRVTVLGKAATLDPLTHQGVVWADFSNESSELPLLPGMFGQAEITLPSGDKQLTVPIDALIREGLEHFVLVQIAPGQFQRQFVAPGRRTAEYVEILGGTVFAEDRVITVGSHELARFFGQEVLRPSLQAAQHLKLVTERVARHPITPVIALPGEVELAADRRTLASARLAGTVYRLLVTRGQHVEAGDVIAEVAGLELQDLQLELLRSHLRVQLLEQTVQRLHSLTEQGGPVALNRRQLREAESALQAAAGKRATAQEKLTAVGLSTQQMEDILSGRQIVAALPIRAPLAGTVVGVRAALGQAVRAEDPLVEIHDAAGALVRGFVSENQAADIRVGQIVRVRLTAEPGWIGTGTVVRRSQEFLSLDRTMTIWVHAKEFPPPPLRHGQLADLTVLRGEPTEVLAVPRTAVFRDGTREFVFVKKRDSTFERRGVVTARGDDLRIAITAGLTAGEEIATSGVPELQTGYAGLK